MLAGRPSVEVVEVVDDAGREVCVTDRGVVEDVARSAKFPVPVAAAALQMFLMTSAIGMGRDDDASVARLYASITGTALAKQPSQPAPKT